MSSPEKPKLAIAVPTYRFDAKARQALVIAAGMGSDDILVHIADNSENPEKHAFLKDLADRNENVVITCHAKNIGALANWLFLLKTEHAPLICLAADDDSFTGTYFRAGLDIMLDDAGCSAASGLHIAVAYGENLDLPSLYSPPERRERDPMERIRAYTGQNAMAYAVVRHQDVRPFLSYVDDNPIKMCFGDYLLAFHLLSIGTYRLDRASFAYIYDDTNWHLPGQAFKSYADYYRLSGLPADFAHFGKLHWAVANRHFFLSRFRSSGLSEVQAAEIAAYLFERYKTDFKKELVQNRRAVEALLRDRRDAEKAVSNLMGCDGSDHVYVFDQFALVVEAFNPDAARRLREFHLATYVPTSARPRPRGWSRFWKRR